MPAPIPVRDRNVYFVGAGLSKALGLPNTAELLDGVADLAQKKTRWLSEQLPTRIAEAASYFYPDAANKGFRPDVVDFFSTLKTYIDVGSGLPGGLHDAPALYRSLKSAIAHLLIERTRDSDARLAAHPYLQQMIQPGNVAITSNWDSVIERYAQIHDIPLRLSGYDANEFVLLKLHGSVDWCLGSDKRPQYPDSDYALLTERLFGGSNYRMALPSNAALEQIVIRIRALEGWNDAWRRIVSRAGEVYLITMARGKSGDLGKLEPIWQDAYHALSRAATLEIVGYSLPPDDVEIRTLLRAGIKRGQGPRHLRVRNPSPEVHERAWRYLRRDAEPDYNSV
jgi:hypothetical protein